MYQVYYRGQYLGAFRFSPEEAAWLRSWDSFMLISQREIWERGQEARKQFNPNKDDNEESK